MKEINGQLRQFYHSWGRPAFGQGIHALQDAFAHRGSALGRDHNITKDQYPGMHASWRDDWIKAEKITRSAIIVHRLFSNDFEGLKGASDKFTIYEDGMTKEKLSELVNKIQQFLNTALSGTTVNLKNLE
ncbi:MAG TPA: hypothetical protein VG738_11845 [Chitinophagaceae bacterium]|nr:hypothetical protein [Chitinophagaceae bacterium]